ncbi:hypothetical protein Amet_2356 [Alkaliphilus metalliredigens QYMF]|uniref:Uncharacterized protein n=1 Tax=Alkaliphilus metalliredigens (strain QYMF) TaxID=293826 RepID=A6TQP2_ALKMQ|nr:hypothetical protein [Alkaliphilus metalliredigens]ABR48510.1 hypothetical protein Amet_2356 [Alkaliphilus metalliredigens QYMF]
MKNKIGHLIQEKTVSSLVDLDFHNFIEMTEDGLSDEEMANELGVSRKYIKQLKDEIYRDY